jgi:hypothetical protein
LKTKLSKKAKRRKVNLGVASDKVAKRLVVAVKNIY